MDLGSPISYETLADGTAVYSADGERIGKVSHVLAAEDLDVFDGVVIGEHVFGEDHRFVDADEVDAIYEHGLVLKLSRAESADLPKPSANPAVMRDDPGRVASRDPAREAEARLGSHLRQLLTGPSSSITGIGNPADARVLPRGSERRGRRRAACGRTGSSDPRVSP